MIILSLIFTLVRAQEVDLKTSESQIFTNAAGAIVGFRCTFEDGWCDGWQNVDFTKQEDYVPSKYFDFVVRRGASSSPATGPAFDHTLKNDDGHYLLLEASQKRFLSRAEIHSAPVDISAYPEYCFSMWYLMYGRHTFSLHVYIQIPSSQSSREMVFKASGSASKTATHWLFTQATIRRPRDWEQGRMANITVAGIRGLSYQADIGLDDISLMPGACPSEQPLDATPPPTTTKAPTTKSVTTAQASTTATNAMVTREWNPFYDLAVLACPIRSADGALIMENYITNTHICCGNKIISRLNGSKCCGQTQYFPRKQQCCNDVIINKSAKYCCDNKITDFSPSEICCKGVVTDKNEDDRCCGDTGLYNKQTQGCCIDTIYELDTQICCGGASIEKTDTRNLCCGSGLKGEKYQEGRDNCCNGNVFSVTKYGCCGSTFVYNKQFEVCTVDEQDNAVITMNEKTPWKKPQHRAGQYLFTYRKRRNVEKMSPREYFYAVTDLRSTMIKTKIIN